MTSAIHAQSSNKHVVGIGALRVVITEENGHWFAQGLEIDYAAEGTSLDDVKERFQKGLFATIDEYIVRFQSIERFLKPASSEIWHEIATGAAVKRFTYSCVSTHVVEEDLKGKLPNGQAFPFGAITYLQQAHV